MVASGFQGPASEAGGPVSTAGEGASAAGFSTMVGTTLVVLACLFVVLIVVRRLWVIPRRHGPSWPLQPELLLFAWIAFLLAGIGGSLIASRLFEGVEGLESRALSMLVAYALQGVMIVVVGVLVARARRSESSDPLPSRSSFGASVGIGCVGFLVAFPLAQSVGMLVGWVQRVVSDVTPDLVAHDTLKDLQDAPGDPWGIVIMLLVVLVTPVIEEFAYRGMVQQGFRRIGGNRTGAIALTSCLFVFMHVPALPEASIASAVATLLTLSVLLGWLFERTGRLITPIIAHGLFNLGNLVLAQYMM